MQRRVRITLAVTAATSALALGAGTASADPISDLVGGATGGGSNSTSNSGLVSLPGSTGNQSANSATQAGYAEEGYWNNSDPQQWGPSGGSGRSSTKTFRAGHRGSSGDYSADHSGSATGS